MIELTAEYITGLLALPGTRTSSSVLIANRERGRRAVAGEQFRRHKQTGGRRRPRFQTPLMFASGEGIITGGSKSYWFSPTSGEFPRAAGLSGEQGRKHEKF